MNQFSAVSSIKAAWGIFVKRPWYLVGAAVVIILISWGIGLVSGLLGAIFGQNAFGSLVSFIVSTLGQLLLGMGTVAFYLKAYDRVEQAALRELWHPKPFWKYLGATLITAICTMIVVIFAVLLGALSIGSLPSQGAVAIIPVLAIVAVLVILALIPVALLILVPYFVIDQGLGAWAAVKGSFEATKEHFWQLVWLLILVVLINILGVLALLVGVLVSSTISTLAIVHAYRTLSKTGAPAHHTHA